MSADTQIVSSDSLIQKEQIRQDLEELVKMKYEGREAGTPGGIRAGEYILHRLKQFKLSPVSGTDQKSTLNGWFQEFKIIGTRHQDVTTSIGIRKGNSLFEALPYSDYYYFFNSDKKLNLDAPLIFTGYAISAPEYRYDDLGNRDIEGKIVLAWYGEPLENDSLIFFNGIHQTKYLLEYWKARSIAARGGKALILMATPDNEEKYDSFLKRRRVQTERLRFVLKEDSVVPVIYLSTEFAESLFGDNLIRNFYNESQRIRDIVASDGNEQIHWNLADISDFEAELQIDYQNQVVRDCRNILAFLPGSHPELSKEYILVGAHYDHEGIQGGKLFPGADDNASGVSANLNVAGAISDLSENYPPERSMIFAFWDSEEKGTLGTSYFVNNPPVKLNQIKAVFNMDMIGRDASFNFAALRQPMRDDGAENKVMLFYSAQAENLRKLAEQANEEIGLQLLFDPNVFFTSGSDHVNFHSLGIPVVYYFTGFHTDYTSPEDTADKINFEKLTRITRHIASFSHLMASRQEIPEFNKHVLTAPEGDFSR
ncbi:MAG: M28 family peptidase [Calditrichaeota bacterium]|nr:M28 family peptidase [Calditrichota bacterium]